MIFVYIIIMLIVTGVAAKAGQVRYKAIQPAKKAGIEYNKYKNLSDISKHIIGMHAKMPNDSKFYGVYGVLSALDSKYGADEVYDHFHTKPDHYSRDQTRKFYANGRGNDCHYSRDLYPGKWEKDRFCNMPEYHRLIVKIDKVLNEAEQQSETLRLAALSGSLDTYDEMMEHLENEKELIRKTTKELNESSN